MNYTNLNNQPENEENIENKCKYITSSCHFIKKYTINPISEYITRLRTIFGLKFLIILAIINLLLNGILFQTVKWSILPIFKSKNLNAGTVQLYTAIIMSPYAIKPILGILSDLIPIAGYNKKWYIFQSTIIGILSAGSLLIFNSTTNVILICFIGINYQASIADLLSEGAYTKIMREHPESGSDIVTFNNGLKFTGQIISLCFLGPLVDKDLYYVIFIIMLIVTSTPLLPTLFNFIPEEKKSNKLITVDTDIVKKSWKTLSIIGFTGLSALTLAILSVMIDKNIVLLVSVLLLICISVGTAITFPNIIFRVVLYQILIKIIKPSLGSAMDYFYTADKLCLPDGPHFDFKYYITYTGLLGTIISLFTVWFYQAFLSKLRFRTVLILTTIFLSMSGVSDMIIVLRWNIKLGIPDPVFYILGEAIIEPVVHTLYNIPISTFISKVCPKNSEASTYAFLAGVNQLSTMVAKLSGVVIFEHAGIKTLVPCDFSNLWWLILVCHITPPLLFGIPLTWLFPDNNHTDSIILDENNSNLLQSDNENDIEANERYTIDIDEISINDEIS